MKGSLVLSTVVRHVHVLLFPAMTIQTCYPPDAMCYESLEQDYVTKFIS